MDVKCQDIHYSIGEKKILNGVSLEVEGGQFQTILGPNGSGKSTLLKTIYRQLKPDSGQIFLDGKSLDQVSLKETAKEMAVVTQFNTLQFDCTVKNCHARPNAPSFLSAKRIGAGPLARPGCPRQGWHV